MAELNDLSPIAANNIGRAPEGWKGPAVNDGLRELEAMIARTFQDTTGQEVTTGTGSAYVLSSARTVTAPAAGHVFLVKAHVDCAAAPTFKAGAAAAKAIVRQNGNAIEAGDIVANQMMLLVYNLALDKFMAVGVGDPWPDTPVYTVAGLPAAGTSGRLVQVSNYADGPALLYDDGTSWNYLSAHIPNSTIAALPAASNWQGRLHITTDGNGSDGHDALAFWDGAAWVQLDDILTPSTTVAARGTTSAGTKGWLRFQTDNGGTGTEPALLVDCNGRSGEAWMELSDRLASFTVAGLPAAASHTRRLVYVTNGTGGPGVAVSDGSVWKWVARASGSVWATVA